MNIGIVGTGVVGSACKFGFEKLGNTVFAHDLRLQTTIATVLPTDIVYICVPTPSTPSGECDTSIVESVVEELSSNNYTGIIAIKSTVRPGTTAKLIDKYKNDKICFVPEFLRERCAIVDFVENNKILIVGTNNDNVYNTIVKSHGKYPKERAQTTPIEAELTKLFHNSINTLRIVFSNEFYEVCQAAGANYTTIKNCAVESTGLPDQYLDVNDSCRGARGVCLSKDPIAFVRFAQSIGVNAKLIETMIEENLKYKPTVFPGMRLS